MIFFCSQQILYEHPKTNDPHEIRFVELDDAEYTTLRGRMIRVGELSSKSSKSGFSWIAPELHRPFSKQ